MDHIWSYVNRFAEFNRFTLETIANYKGELYNLPFNMNTFYRMWGASTPDEAEMMIRRQRRDADITEPSNLEEQAISLVGRDIYEKLIKGYTEKQWGRACRDLPPFIIKRLPVRFRYDNNYFDDLYQGVPVNGYTKMIEKMLDGVDVDLHVDYLTRRTECDIVADRIIYTGQIDGYYDYCFGELEWRSLRFETDIMDMSNYQGVAIMNYTDRETPYTRIIEHKHFTFGEQPVTVITKEYPATWEKGREAYYPLNDERNTLLYERYAELAKGERNVSFGGRLGGYRYCNMDETIDAALKLIDELCGS
jgi:UDP-galactopyranose mutase